jgi:hypothetical protein
LLSRIVYLWVFDGGGEVDGQLASVQLPRRLHLLVPLVLEGEVAFYQVVDRAVVGYRLAEELANLSLLLVPDLLLFPLVEGCDLILPELRLLLRLFPQLDATVGHFLLALPHALL